MGELSQWEAKQISQDYRDYYRQVKEDLRMNFDDMDFENANKKDSMLEKLESMERVCEQAMADLDAMTFEEG